MALTDTQRGPRAAWLYHGRVDKFGSGAGGQKKLADALGTKGNYRAPDTIKGWEAGKAPIPDTLVPTLEILLGQQAPPPVRMITPEDIVGALDRQTAAISDLVTEMRLARERDQDAAAAMLRAAEALLSARLPEAVGASIELAAPVGSSR